WPPTRRGGTGRGPPPPWVGLIAPPALAADMPWCGV
ncbi:YceK/YidQ family lipoprotein, partial [Pseudomonas aeruginosa]|nr:YceK/YidQ family lipoprotein [Pseudomonas aeruginosa]